MKISNHLTKLSAKAADAVAASPNPDADVSEKYSDEEIAKWCVDLKYKNKDEFYRHQIIQRGGEYTIFCNGRYEPTDSFYNEKDALGALDRDLARAEVEVYKYDKNGNAIKRKMAEIVERHGAVARALSLSLVEQHTRYDQKTCTLIQATAPLRVTTPRYHEEVDRWLKLYDDTGKVQDWIACVTLLDRQCAALFLNGVPGYGKTLLASGLSRLWGSQGYVEMKQMLESEFNGSVLKMPFVFADEKLPEVKNVGSKIRTLIGSDKITVNEKFLRVTQVSGNARYMIAANNPDVFRTDEELQNQDLEAIGERILFHRPADAGLAAREYLMSLSANQKQSFRDDDKIAEHALWLRETRKVIPGKRFVVQGEVTEFHEDLAVSTGKSAAVCEWIVRYIASYKRGAQNTPYIRVVDGQVLANPSAMNRQVEWETHVPGHRVPSTEIVAKALRRIETKRELITIDGVQVPFSSIKATLLARVAEKMGTMTAEEFLRKVEQCN